ncbi:hypothetical protein GCM10018781_34750 [Kitasatospora indigofera]|uniref:Uncharacterized protein n=1 Tax=Kitasatospora indigofera TaxID=67307 RepID=A0A919KTV0_9ACTN|nr:hypothetical protein GCM10018781_34750 [Kitasatospora indigofera]
MLESRKSVDPARAQAPGAVDAPGVAEVADAGGGDERAGAPGGAGGLRSGCGR